MVWEPKFAEIGEFEFWCVISENNLSLIKKDNLIWIGTEDAGIIEDFEESVSDNGEKKIDVKGKLLNKYLTRRIIWGTYNGSGYSSKLMREIVEQNMINPSDANRKIDFLELSGTQDYGEKIIYQQTGKEVENALEELCESCESKTLGFNICLDVENEKLLFKVLQGVDRSKRNTDGNKVVMLSTDLKDILSSKYSYSSSSFKNVALVAGQDSGADRKKVVSGNNESRGIHRFEMYVDARDLRQTDNNQNKISDEDYEKILTNRGNAKIDECKTKEKFEAKCFEQ